jgi:hypothetical protein
VAEFIFNGLAVIFFIFVPFYLGSSIGKVAPYTGYTKPVLGLLVAIPVSFIAPYALWRSQFHVTNWFDMDVFTKWLLPLTLLFIYGYILEVIETLKSDEKDKKEGAAASPEPRYHNWPPPFFESIDDNVEVSNAERSGGADASLARKQVNHGNIEERLRILLSHPIILVISFCASVLGIIGFVLQFFLDR